MAEHDRSPESSQEVVDMEFYRVPEVTGDLIGKVLERDAPVAAAYEALGHTALTTEQLAQKLGVTLPKHPEEKE